jgi:predicted PurR-regulated permease PerM
MKKTERRWSSTTKTIVILFIVILVALIVYRFQDVIPPLVIALLLAFILDPIVSFLNNRLRLSRGLASGLVILALVIALLAAVATPAAAVPSIQRAVESMQEEATSVVTEISAFLRRPVEIMGYTLDLSEFYNELTTLLRSFISSVAEGTLNVAINIASGFLWLVFILTITFYLLKDAQRIVAQLDKLPPKDYREDLVRLRLEITEVWQAFLRGQLLLGLVIAVFVTVGCMALGVRYAPVLGLIAGLLEVIPNIGPIIAALPAVLLALFQENTFMGLSNFWYAALVTGMYLVVQQIENNLIVPRVMGRSLNLHPVLVLVGVVVGGSLGGVLGILLAAPTLATLKVIGRYIFYRIYDLDPFAESKEDESPSKPGLAERVHKAFLKWVQEKREPEDAEPEEAPSEPDASDEQPAE